VLFRSRASHREFERELERLGIPTYVYKGLGFFDADETKDVIALIRYLARPVSDLRAAAFLRSRFVRLSDRALSALAPGLAAALMAAVPPAALDRLDDEDRRVLAHTRAQVASWLQRVDRVPPADLLEALLRETAYAYELRGPRRLQAWENLKKIRGMIRRIQNRGYATLPRLADHIDALTAGDESNAVIEALDAVHLMTVHASKGLEFPIVFVVNMAKGAGGIPKPVRVIDNGDQPSVSIGPFVSDVDEADRAREKHELRRLLYVGFTRARDRLYLSSAMKSGVLAPGRGSLAEVLPDSFRELFARAAAAAPDETFVTWSGSSGSTFRFALCRPPEAQESHAQPAMSARAVPATLEAAQIHPAALSPGPSRTPVTEALDELGSDTRMVNGGSSDAVIGRLVHRLFQFAARQPREGGAVDHAPDVRRRAAELLSAEERATLDDAPATLDAAAAAWASIAERADVAELLRQGRPQFEVPFSFYDPVSQHIMRGAIDCLVWRPDGGITVVEFKTGRRRAVHEQQLSIYVRATEAIFPGTAVDGLLIYA
jgi:ATP-dependent exoDNAse (exonuclease V) beta subunit